MKETRGGFFPRIPCWAQSLSALPVASVLYLQRAPGPEAGPSPCTFLPEPELIMLLFSSETRDVWEKAEGTLSARQAVWEAGASAEEGEARLGSPAWAPATQPFWAVSLALRKDSLPVSSEVSHSYRFR